MKAKIIAMYICLVMLLTAGFWTKASARVVMLIDVSGSMYHNLKELEILLPPLADRYREIRIYTYSDVVKRISRSDLSHLSKFKGHYTKLYLAFNLMQTVKPKGIILVTDGRPNYPRKSLKEALSLNRYSKICSILVGNDKKGLSFLKKISFKVININDNALEESLYRCIGEFRKLGIILDPYQRRNIYKVYSGEPTENQDLDVE